MVARLDACVLLARRQPRQLLDPDHALSFMNMPILTYINEISPRPVLLIHGEKAHSRLGYTWPGRRRRLPMLQATIRRPLDFQQTLCVRDSAICRRSPSEAQ